MDVIRFLDAQKTILRWLLISAFIQTGYVIPSTPNHPKNNLLSPSQFYAFYVACQQLTKEK